MNPKRLTGLLIVFFLCLHVFYASVLGLTADGAHYALYGKFLAWGYFDHPPLVGWLQALIEHVALSNLALRLWPLFFSLALWLLLYRVVLLAWSETPGINWIAFLAVLLLSLAPVLNFLSIMLLPQLPLLLFALLAVYFVLKIEQAAEARFYLGLGFALMLAILSEYTSVILCFSFLIYFLCYRRQDFMRPIFWSAMVIALLGVLPTLYWNMGHHWAGIHYQLHHGFYNHWQIKRFLQSQLIQFGAYSPAVYLLGFYVVYRYRQSQDRFAKLLLLIAIPVWLLFAYSGGRERILPHWPAMCWLMLMPIIAKEIYQNWHKLWLKLIVYISSALMTVAYLFCYSQLTLHWLHFKIDKSPFRDLFGWQQAGATADQLLQDIESRQFPKPMLFVNNWSLASRLSWYANHPVQIIGANKVTQFTFWYGNPKAYAYGVLVVPAAWSHPKTSSEQPGSFKHCNLLQRLPVYDDGVLLNRFDFYWCTNYQ